MASPGVQNGHHDLIGPRRAAWSAGTLLQAGRPVTQVSVDPLVSGLAGDAVELAQLGERQRVAKVIGDELRSLVHG
jgi:hypothetical protein